MENKIYPQSKWEEYYKKHYRQERIYSLNSYLKETYGYKLYKLALNGGMTCPNRDGALGDRGCIFCSEKGSGDFSSEAFIPIGEQLEKAKIQIQKKMNTKHFIAYFQSFTNTYASVTYLRTIYMQAIEDSEVEILSIATRPDCLNREILMLLKEINQIKPIWIELGLQSIHEDTAKYIRRGYDLPVYEQTIKALKDIGVKVITHVIIGLPGEDKKKILETVQYVANTDTFGIKLQLLHVLKNTDLFDEYKALKFKTLELEEYIDILFDALASLPPWMVVHRITGDGPKAILESPLWSANKRMVLNTIRKEMKERNLYQGCKYVIVE